MFAVIRHYHFKPQDSAEIDKMVRENFVPLIKKANGFVRYYFGDEIRDGREQKGNGGTMAAVSIFRPIRQSIVGFDRPFYYFGLQINEFGHMSFDF